MKEDTNQGRLEAAGGCRPRRWHLEMPCYFGKHVIVCRGHIASPKVPPPGLTLIECGECDWFGYGKTDGTYECPRCGSRRLVGLLRRERGRRR